MWVGQSKNEKIADIFQCWLYYHNWWPSQLTCFSNNQETLSIYLYSEFYCRCTTSNLDTRLRASAGKISGEGAHKLTFSGYHSQLLCCFLTESYCRLTSTMCVVVNFVLNWLDGHCWATFILLNVHDITGAIKQFTE